MKHLYICLSMSIIAILSLQLTCQKAPSASNQKKIVFLWDIHGVMLTRNIGQTFVSYLNPLNFLPAIGKLNLKTMQAISNSFKSDGSVEQLIEESIKNNNQYLTRILINQSNSQRPIHGTWDIIKELSKNGYTHYIGSNINRYTFKELIDVTKNPTLAPIFTYFNLNAPQTANDSGITKPSAEFYISFLRKNNIDLTTTQVIFIDDRIENVTAAANVGFVAVHFKNSVQLRDDLFSLGITILPHNPHAKTWKKNKLRKKVSFAKKTLINSH